MVLVEVQTDEGLTGYGEIKGSPLKAIAEWVDALRRADPRRRSRSRTRSSGTSSSR